MRTDQIKMLSWLCHFWPMAQRSLVQGHSSSDICPQMSVNYLYRNPINILASSSPDFAIKHISPSNSILSLSCFWQTRSIDALFLTCFWHRLNGVSGYPIVLIPGWAARRGAGFDGDSQRVRWKESLIESICLGRPWQICCSFSVWKQFICMKVLNSKMRVTDKSPSHQLGQCLFIDFPSLSFSLPLFMPYC